MRVFLTGFPGFIGARIVDALASRTPDASFVLLVQERMLTAATRRLRSMGLEERAEICVGDLTEPDLGLDADALTGVTHVWHLAAIYDLAVPEDLAVRVNVDGTRHLLDAIAGLEDLQRLIYFSTCYVAGKRQGRVYEGDLDVGQGFHNFYESTKYAAELEVRQRMPDLPAIILRPAVVVGDSKTGETDKYDGPYFAIRTLMRSPKWLRFMVGEGSTTMNIVPVDFIVDAALAISEHPDAVGETCQLADPAPITIKELVEHISTGLGRRPPTLKVPLSMVEKAFGLKRVRRLFGVPQQTVQYMNYDVQFDSTVTQRLLADSGVSCPALPDYLPVLINYVKAHPHKGFLDGRKL